MKTEFVDVSETRKNLVVEIDSSTVDAEIDRVARDYTKAARIPGFRPGKVPARVVKQRFREPDSPRRGARAGASGGGRRAARARPRTARHAGHSRRGRRRGPAAEVHGDIRHRPELRSPAVSDRCSCGGRRSRCRKVPSTRRCRPTRAGGAVRGHRGTPGRAGRHGGGRSGARGRHARRPTRTRTSRSRLAPRPIHPGSTTR